MLQVFHLFSGPQMTYGLADGLLIAKSTGAYLFCE